MRMLVDYYYTATLPGTDIPLSRLPLIVNTHGWLKGSLRDHSIPRHKTCRPFARSKLTVRRLVGCCG
jgi:hypothetical protein